MSKLSTEAKQAIVEKVLARDGRTVKEIAEAHNIGYSTLFKWVRKSLNGVIVNSEKPGKNNQALSISERFQHLMATASLDETATGIYCRENGLYAIQLTQWKNAFICHSAPEFLISSFPPPLSIFEADSRERESITAFEYY